MKRANRGQVKIGYTLFLILLVLMPMHTLIFSRILASIKILSLWRDLAIVVLVILAIKGKLKNNILDISILLVVLFIITYTLISGRLSSLNTARTYCVPIAIYFYTRNRRFSDHEIDKILKTLMITAAVIAVWGISQAFVLGPSIMFKLGYASNGNRFTSTAFYINGWSQQRVIGTFSAPNACGAYFAVMLVVLWYFRNWIKNQKLYWVCLILVSIGLIGTFSRSAWIGCTLGLMFFNRKKIHITKKMTRFIGMAAIVMVVGLVVLSRTSIYQTMYSMFVSHVGNTVSQQDASFIFHIQQLYKPMEDLFQHPFGLGFGTNGSIALAHLSLEQTHQVESSIWVMGYELGIIGLLVYYFPYVYILVHFGKQKNNEFATCAAKVCICTLMTYLVLPSVQNYEAPFYVMLFAGLATNSERGCVICTMKSKHFLKYKTVM